MSRRTGLRLRRRAGELRMSLLGAGLPVLLLLLPLLLLLLLLEMVFTSAECISHQLAEISACRVDQCRLQGATEFYGQNPHAGNRPTHMGQHRRSGWPRIRAR